MAQAANLVGRQVSVLGPLHRGFGFCTLAGCYSTLAGCTNVCCNKCSEGFALATEAALREEERGRKQRMMLHLHGEQLGCDGDESLTCCKFAAAGQGVIARGALRFYETVSGPVYFLEDATICTPPDQASH